MKKIFVYGAVIAALLSLTKPVSAQMMGWSSGVTVTSQEELAVKQDEAAGKEIWDRIQGGQVACQRLKDGDFDKLGDFFMGSMMGAGHAYMDKAMSQRMGDAGEQQMHIYMGKRLSGCDENAPLPSGAGYFIPMMGGAGGMMGAGWNLPGNGYRTGMMGTDGWNMMGYWGIAGIITWILVILFLLSGVIFFWRGITRRGR